MTTANLSVQGMTCGGCAKAVAGALRAIDGVTAVDVSFAAGTAAVQFDEEVTSPDSLSLAVQRAGYGVAGAKPAGTERRGGCCCG